jgi:hypothetical protein
MLGGEEVWNRAGISVAICDCDCLEPRVSSDGAEQVPNVVADRLGAQLKLLGDLPRRATALEKFEDFRLPRCELKVRMYVKLLDEV